MGCGSCSLAADTSGHEHTTVRRVEKPRGRRAQSSGVSGQGHPDAGLWFG
eukprot:CAMPEP_0119464392 /NCGR_PEP_ID=MMETSP1344-20130328/16_1 /TAXON_ID=236787 /ORGANISM="Florenciella parvula, Strain CCMP2471" /LENGTH=49 /DNA_ID= /DNA_START= /DNA_END= /DNA_ORIENTATION=